MAITKIALFEGKQFRRHWNNQEKHGGDLEEFLETARSVVQDNNLVEILDEIEKMRI